MAGYGEYTVVAQAQAVSTAITILEVTAPSTSILEIHRAWCQNTSSTTSAMNRIEILRKSGTITGTTSPPTARPTNVAQGAFDGTIKWLASAEGTDGVILLEESWNVLNGWLYLPVPEERIIVPPSGIIALKFPAAPANASYSFGFAFVEKG